MEWIIGVGGAVLLSLIWKADLRGIFIREIRIGGKLFSFTITLQEKKNSQAQKPEKNS